jgi:hypothetical protein
MSDRVKDNVVDLTDEPDARVADELAVKTNASSSSKSRKRKAEQGEYVWIAMYQMEAQYGGAGDYHRERRMGITAPKTFDATILGLYTTKEAANRAAKEYCLEHGWFDDNSEDEEASHEVEDFEGEGEFRDGADSGDVNTYSERVFIRREFLHHATRR